MAKKKPFKKEILKLSQDINILSNINTIQVTNKWMAKHKKKKRHYFTKYPSKCTGYRNKEISVLFIYLFGYSTEKLKEWKIGITKKTR